MEKEVGGSLSHTSHKSNPKLRGKFLLLFFSVCNIFFMNFTTYLVVAKFNSGEEPIGDGFTIVFLTLVCETIYDWPVSILGLDLLMGHKFFYISIILLNTPFKSVIIMIENNINYRLESFYL